MVHRLFGKARFSGLRSFDYINWRTPDYCLPAHADDNITVESGESEPQMGKSVERIAVQECRRRGETIKTDPFESPLSSTCSFDDDADAVYLEEEIPTQLLYKISCELLSRNDHIEVHR